MPTEDELRECKQALDSYFDEPQVGELKTKRIGNYWTYVDPQFNGQGSGGGGNMPIAFFQRIYRVDGSEITDINEIETAIEKLFRDSDEEV